jgi:hypothetical protein
METVVALLSAQAVEASMRLTMDADDDEAEDEAEDEAGLDVEVLPEGDGIGHDEVKVVVAESGVELLAPERH